jgi:hypothetical protein
MSPLDCLFKANPFRLLGQKLRLSATKKVEEKKERYDKALRDSGGNFIKDRLPEKAVPLFREVYHRNPSSEVALGEYAWALCEADAKTELDELAKSLDLHALDGKRSEYCHDLTPLERAICAETARGACQTPEALAQLSRAVEYLILNRIKGDLVECGVYKGASVICMIRTLQSLSVSDRKIWLYDTYEGMPEPEEIDQFYATNEVHDGGLKTWALLKREDGSKGSDWVYSPLEEVQHNVSLTQYPPDHLKYVKGLVEDTIPNEIPNEISLLRLDTDFYKSTKHELEHLYPRVTSGGVIIIDDYGAYQGSQKAVDEFIKEKGLRVLLGRVDEHVRIWIKP